MSDTVFANLPRFDTVTRGHGMLGKSFDDRPAAHDTTDNRGGEDEAAAESPDEAAEQRLAAIEDTLTSLSAAADDIRDRARREASDNIASVAEKLFPKLSHMFLAEEIGRHLPDLLPMSAPEIEIRAEAELAGQLREIVQRSNRIAGLCTVTEDEAPGANRVNITWQEGGVDFDFDSLLDSCVQRLQAANSNEKG